MDGHPLLTTACPQACGLFDVERPNAMALDGRRRRRRTGRTQPGICFNEPRDGVEEMRRTRQTSPYLRRQQILGARRRIENGDRRLRLLDEGEQVSNEVCERK